MLRDIKNVSPGKGELFFVDTNVWYWMTYFASKSFVPKGPKQYQIENYPNFIEQAVNNKAVLYYSPLMLIELTSLIERAEFEIFKAFKNDQNFSFKRFRNDQHQRKVVIDELHLAWEQVRQLAIELPAKIGDDLECKVLDYLRNFNIDGYDSLYYYFMKQNNIVNIITDDKDFRGLDGIELYSCFER
ncbi:PIN domain-containing protein [Halopseudomonas pelagia]|uniref:PIN domain-containing protein n=1 Tax=Halopseudomonas pelagia TaxID=553151 RepID=A0AA91Z5T3_9GAMM|nr:PIN domain-containing protein [Halopseudomonas pelagia]PCC98989.1 PIN domain-containing protein [Halopseudomonas pelagia]QFY55418.1 PIN domain-containing protein [Halopseudomonas pelagia]